MIRKVKVLEHENLSSASSDPTPYTFSLRSCGQMGDIQSLPPQAHHGAFHLLELQKYVLVS